MSATTEWVEGGAPGISAARLNEPFHVRAASFDSVNNRINVTIGPGRAAFLGVIAERLADTIHHIAAPTVNTTYHIYVHSNNTFSHNTTGAEPAGAVRLGTVRTGAALADPMTRTDVRGQLPGAAARAHADEATAHGSTGAIVGVDSSITIDPVPAPTGNVGGLRALLGWLANRIRAITGTTNWWDAPATTLATAHTHHGATAPHTGHETLAGAQSKVDAHAGLTAPHGATPAPTADRIILRDAAGRAQVAAPAVAADIARMDTVTGYAVNRAGDTMTGNLFAPDVLWGGGTRGLTLTSGTDLNNVVISGWYDGNNLVNRPAGPSEWGHVMVSRAHSNLWVSQTYMSLHNENDIFIRRSADGGGGVRVWSPWQRIWHSGNDGIGSGLDADLVRGLGPTAAATGNSIIQRDAAGRAQVVDGAVAADIATWGQVSARMLANRQGGHATDWHVGGAINYAVTTAHVQVGATAPVSLAGGANATITVTFPLAFAASPLVTATPQAVGSGSHIGSCIVISVSNTQVVLRLQNHNVVDTLNWQANWIAHGPR